MHYGRWMLKLSPQQYLERLTDYSENKRLNYLSAYPNPDLCLNIITEVGFGTGPMKPFLGHPNPHYPLVFPDMPGVNRVRFPFHRPENLLTFQWFKHNIMCRGQPWICGHRQF
ncbi:uncharacterized protein LOC134845652 [Symsagittifera roscoffensis]|uniref:uncharacterized protein LOC134845652 n=1 Tax=Symsagittifera roscoffensis TaxID=84072 RepID=UPI00307B3BE4